MRDAPLADFQATPHHAYYAHVSSSPSGDACGLVLVRAGSGRSPCRGMDNIRDDGYEGHVHLNRDGGPIPHAPVQYFKLPDDVVQDTPDLRDKTFIAQTATDEQGRHRLKLEAGTYAYRILAATHEDPQKAAHVTTPEVFVVTVEPGRLVTWEDVACQSDAEMSEYSGALSREIGFVTEDLICEWSRRDNAPFSWHDVESTIAAINQKCSAQINGTFASGIAQISFNRFARPDIINSLQRRGLNALDLKWSERHLAAAFRNLGAMIAAEFLELTPHRERNHQLSRNVEVKEKSVVGRDGMPIYLAEATASAVYFAAQEAAWSPSGHPLPFWSPSMDSPYAGGNPYMSAVGDILAGMGY